MTKATNLLLMALLGGVLILALGAGGYFVYTTIDQVHSDNVTKLESFGIKAIPVRTDQITIGELGQVQLPPSIQEKKLNPTEKVILALSQQKEALVAELADAKNRVEELEAELALLKAYQQENERYAPLPMREERQRALTRLLDYLDRSPEADRFDAFQRQAMALSAANIYREMLVKYRLSFEEAQKDQVIDDHLPAYSFCIGQNIGFVANGSAERKRLLEYLQNGDPRPLNAELKADLETIRRPCVQALNERINRLLAAG